MECARKCTTIRGRNLRSCLLKAYFPYHTQQYLLCSNTTERYRQSYLAATPATVYTMAWQMPIYREPTLIETTIDDFVRQIQANIDYLVSSNERLGCWWKSLHRPSLCCIALVLGIIFLWIAHSKFASWGTTRAHQAQMKSLQNKRHGGTPTASSRQTMHDVNSEPETPVQRYSTGYDSSLSAVDGNAPLSISENADGRTGRVSTPGYRTPYVNNSDRRNFSGLAKTAPVCYATLLRNNVLDVEGTPTKKFSPAPQRWEQSHS